jgi:hypothetical protein
VRLFRTAPEFLVQPLFAARASPELSLVEPDQATTVGWTGDEQI